MSSEDWEKSWPQEEGGPRLRPGTDLSELPLQRLRWAFDKASTFYANQAAWFREYTPEVRHVSSPSGTRHEFSLVIQAPVEEWALFAGEILNHLSSARDNLFKDIVRRATGWSDREIKKHLGRVYWPSCFHEREWEVLTTKYDFIPQALMDRIELFQPFRDRRPGEEPTDMEWMKSGASAWARRLNNDDKHDQPVEVAVHHYLGGPVTAHTRMRLLEEPRQRWDDTDPYAAEPLLTLHTEPVGDLQITVPSIDVVLMARSSSGAKWDPLNSGVWSALVESQMVLNTVYYGRERAEELSIASMEYASQGNWADFRYELNPAGEYDMFRRSNAAQDALDQNYV